MRLGRSDRSSAILSRDVVLIYEPINLMSPYDFKVSNREPLQIQIGLALRRMVAILITGLECDDLHSGLSALSRGQQWHGKYLAGLEQPKHQ